MMHLGDHYQQDQITGAASAGTGLESCHLGSWPCLPPPLSTLDAGEFEPDAVSGDCRRDTSILFRLFLRWCPLSPQRAFVNLSSSSRREQWSKRLNFGSGRDLFQALITCTLFCPDSTVTTRICSDSYCLCGIDCDDEDRLASLDF
jgi:hypothetical protein